jgi:hypothetical protein
MIALLAPETPKRGDLLQRISGTGEVLAANRWTGTVRVLWGDGVATYGAAEVRERIESGDWHHVPGDDYESVEG